jgi:hypothetical protein
MKSRVFLGMLAWLTFHVRLLLLLWLVPRFAPPILETLGLPQWTAEPTPEVVRFRFSTMTADVAESSRVEEAPDTPIQGRFNSEARDEIVDDLDTPVPAGAPTGPDNSIAGTGAEVERAGNAQGEDPPQAAEPTPPPPALADAAGLMTPGARERLPTSVQEMLTGERQKPQRPGFGERVSADFEQRGARQFGAFAFSTYAWDFEPYWHHMRRKLYGAWHPPAAWLTYGIVSDGWSVVRAVIETDGRLSEATVVETFGHESLHRASHAAMQGAAPFRALPRDFPDEKLVVFVRFEYGGVRPNREHAP